MIDMHVSNIEITSIRLLREVLRLLFSLSDVYIYVYNIYIYVYFVAGVHRQYHVCIYMFAALDFIIYIQIDREREIYIYI